jgi:putative membrane protein
MKAKRILKRIFQVDIILVIYYMVGVTGMVLPLTRDLFIRLVPLTLLGSLTVLFVYHGKWDLRQVVAGLLIFAAGFLVEMVGVATGLLFGEYHYGATLGVKLFETPLMIGVNWLMMVYLSSAIAGRFVENAYFRSIVAGAMMVIYDVTLEPVAMRLDMWDWAGGVVPLQNYIAWFVIGASLNYLAARMKLVRIENKAAAPLFFIQLGFFIALNIWIVAESVWG